MKHFWKLGMIAVIFTLLNVAGLGTALAKSHGATSERYNLPYSSASTSTATHTVAKQTASASKYKHTTLQQKGRAPAPEYSIYSQQIVQESRSFPPFSAIDVAGPFKVDITGHDGQQRAVFTGNVNAVPRVTSRVIGNTLVIRMLPSKTGQLVPPYNPRVAIQIHTSGGLTAISAGGSSQIFSAEISSPHLALNTTDQSSLHLRGHLSVYKIVCNSSGNIDVALGHISGIGVGGAGSGYIRLTGSVDTLTAALGGWLRLDAAQLRAQKVYIETWDNGCGEVLPVISLYAFARDYSNIFYYKKPQIMSGNSRGSGNILRLGNR